MLNIAIVDDEKVQSDLLCHLINKWADKNEKQIKFYRFENAESFLFFWSDNKGLDIIILDIQMKGMNGVELAKNIRSQDENITIIFATGFSEYMEEGYDVSALHYLIKPVQEDKLFTCMNKACTRIKKDIPSLIINTEGETIRILQDEIVFAEAFAHTIVINTIKASYEVKMSMSSLENSIDKTKFVRCHRSYLVGLKYILKIQKADLILDNNKTIPVSRRLYNAVNQAFISFYREGGTE